MSCDGCERNVENSLRNVNGVRRVDADNEAETVEVVVEDDVDDDELETAIDDAGYAVVA